ncbi:helix-turn-helix domain-containing protein [Chryseobacterium artocarpi]|uniref:helix-turn-helix domain-containing protein n=1 Tax=Chryseobacterium artocarpi TaxID=1414727 RepID=UPI000B041074|nr:helix-turn-helix transcriptional regulator [Chryseobacterium artocarpi]
MDKIIGIHRAAIGIYERDKVKPSIVVTIKIADTLQVSLDYLVGKTSLEVVQNTL